MMSKIALSANASEYGIVKFMEFVASEIKTGDRLLDAGAGSAPYRKYFGHTEYQSADISGKHDMLCNLDNIPVKDCSYDAIVNTQVLEHVESPSDVMSEFYRILDKGGRLFLTVPQGYGVHGDCNYFNFLKQGVESLFVNAGFRVVSIEPLGGMFWLMGKHTRVLPWYILRQYMFKDKFKLSVMGILLLPFFILSLPVCWYLIPWLCFYLDKLDKKRDWTLTYGCYGVKV